MFEKFMLIISPPNITTRNNDFILSNYHVHDHQYTHVDFEQTRENQLLKALANIERILTKTLIIDSLASLVYIC